MHFAKGMSDLMNNIQDMLNDALEHHRAGRVDKAEKLYNRILEADPNNHMCLYFSGMIAYENKNLDKAVDLIYRASIINPCADYYTDLANIYVEYSQPDKAIEFYNYALNLNPDDPVLNNSIGKLYFKFNNIAEAAKYFQKAIELDKNFEDAYFELGNLFKSINSLDGAMNCYLQAVKLKPDHAEAYLYLGEILKDQNNFSEAANCFREVLKTMPDNPVAIYNLGEIFENTGKYDEALLCFERIKELLPDCSNAYYKTGQIQLLREDFDNGWKNYEYRLVMRKPEYRINIDKSLWNGDSLEDKTIYVSSEMGYGDTIMMARYLPVLNSMGAKVICKPQKELFQLFKDSDLKAEIIDQSIPDNQVNCDTYVQFMSLPYKLKTNTDNIPNSNSYLKANPEKVRYYKEKFFNNDDLKVGLVWHCKNLYPLDKFRSFEHISSFSDIAKLPGVKLYSLQKGDGVEQLASLPAGISIVDLGSTFDDFSDTAAAIENLDLLISIDTSVPHLAGAMGKPVWLLLPDIKDWKWFLRSKDCPWYSSVTLFRQKQLGDWNSVIQDVCNSLGSMVNNSGKLPVHSNDEVNCSAEGENLQNKLVKALELHKSQYIVEAEALYKEIIRENPDNDMALQFLGILLLESGRYSESLAYLKRCAQIAPTAEIYTDMAEIYNVLNQNDEALQCYLKAIDINPANPELCYQVGMIFYKNGDITNALEYLKQVLQYLPDHTDTLYLIGMILHNTNQTKQAIEFYKRAIELNLVNEGIYYNIGAAYYNEYSYSDAVKCFEKAVELNPNNPDNYNNLGSSYQALNNLEKAVENYRKAVEISPRPFYKYNLGRALVLTEQFEEGWELFESRIDLFEWHKLKYDPVKKPKWNGQPLEGKTVFVYIAGGNGDAILLARYLPVLNSMGAKVLCSPYDGLTKLFKQSDLKAEIIPYGNLPDEAEFDYQLPFFSCCHAFKVNRENVPYKDGYLKADPEKVKFYKENYFNNNNFKIGLCWKCSQKSMDTRSIPLKYLYKLKEIENARFYSLQKFDGLEQLNEMPDDFEMVELGETFDDFADTAAAIENLDLVIRIDTATVHLAGALGKKTYALIPFAPDWRWLLNDSKCIWFNSVTLLRQKEVGNWQEVVDRLICTLK